MPVPIQLVLRYRNSERLFETAEPQVIVGRPRPGQLAPDLDLSPDQAVSRPHLRVFFSASQWWLEDLGSKHGTQVNGTEIRAHGPQPLQPGDTVRCGNTDLLFLGETGAHFGPTLDFTEQVSPPFGGGAHSQYVPDALLETPPPASLESVSPAPAPRPISGEVQGAPGPIAGGAARPASHLPGDSRLFQDTWEEAATAHPPVASPQTAAPRVTRPAAPPASPIATVPSVQHAQGLQALLEQLRLALPRADRAALWVCDDSSGLPPHPACRVGLNGPLGVDPLARRVLRERRSLYWAANTEGAGEDEAPLGDFSISAALAAPLVIFRGEEGGDAPALKGVVGIESFSHAQPLLPDDLPVLELGAAALGHAVTLWSQSIEGPGVELLRQRESQLLGEDAGSQWTLHAYLQAAETGLNTAAAVVLCVTLPPPGHLGTENQDATSPDVPAAQWHEALDGVFREITARGGFVAQSGAHAITAVFAHDSGRGAVQATLAALAIAAGTPAARAGLHLGQIWYQPAPSGVRPAPLHLGQAYTQAAQLAGLAPAGQAWVSAAIYQRIWKEFRAEQVFLAREGFTEAPVCYRVRLMQES